MKKIIISHPTEIEHEIAHVNTLLDSNVNYFHIRKPQFEVNEMTNYIQSIDTCFHYKLIIHSHYHLIQKFDLGGIHLNQKSLSELILAEESDKCFIEPMLLKNNQIEINRVLPESVSYSAHSIEEIKNLQFKTDYVFLSPIFNSISKPNYKSKFKDFELLKGQLNDLKTSVVALGGVTENKIDLLTEIGFKGYALLGSYWMEVMPLSSAQGKSSSLRRAQGKSS